MATQTDLTIVLEDRPGIVAAVGETLGRAGINVEGVCGLTSGGFGILHVLLADDSVEAAVAALEEERIEVRSQRTVWVTQCPDRPGEMGRVMRRLAEADVNCDLVYLSTTGRLVVGAETMEQVAAVLG